VPQRTVDGADDAAGGTAEGGEAQTGEPVVELDAGEPAVEPDAGEPAVEIDADLCHAVADDLRNEGRAAEAETFYRAALSLAPDRPDSWANLGLVVLREGRAAEAVECERQALRIDPCNVDALNNLGVALYALNALVEAENHFRAVLRLVPDHANATLNLGVARQSLGHLEEAETLYHRARALGVDEARVCNNLGLALAELGRLEAAETACRDALAAKADYPEAAVNLGMILLMRGKLAEGWPWYEARWRIEPLLSQARLPDATRWTGEGSVEGKTILLTAEQGFGDALQFCRYAPMVARLGAKVVLAVPATLGRLMGSLKGVARVVSQDDVLPEFDLHCPLMSLPMAFGTTEDTIPWRVPYLEADPDAIDRWREIVPPARDTKQVTAFGAAGLRVGLVWAGGCRPGQPHAAAIDRRRSMKLAEMEPLAAVPGCVFVSLQVGPPAAQIGKAPLPLIDVTAGLTDFADTAALVETLDLIISVDTAVAHVAGALGKPVWLLSRHDACWRWGRDRDDTPWYPTMRLFRQTAPGDWAGVMRRVAEALPAFQAIG
jgi:Flp pilus assembly protein TadD